MRKNAKHEVFASKTPRRHGGRPTVGRRLAHDYRRFCATVALCWDRERARRRLRPINAGRWVITVHAFWDRQRHLDVNLPIGDIDAPIECVLDALQAAGVVDNDARFVAMHSWKHHDPRHPRLVIEIEEAPPEGLLPPCASDREEVRGVATQRTLAPRRASRKT